VQLGMSAARDSMFPDQVPAAHQILTCTAIRQL
jgi:hypothetical protein